MYNLWVPQDNKFVTELQIILEQIKFNIRRIEADLKINSSKTEAIKIKLNALKDNLEVLKDKNTKIISLSEYRTISESLKEALGEKWIVERRDENFKKSLEMEQSKIPIIETEIEKVKFKLLEFKKNEKTKR